MDPNTNPEQPIQPQQQATSQPDLPTQPVQPPQTPMYTPADQPMMNNAMVQSHDPGQGLGIASLICSLLGLGLVGIILGAISISKSKKSGHKTNVLGLIGLIWGIVSGLIVIPIMAGSILNNFNGAQAKARDTSNVTSVNALHSKLEEYYNNNGSYPSEVSDDVIKGAVSTILYTSDNKKVGTVGGSKTLKEAESKSLPTNQEPYQYIPYGCSANDCLGYVLRIRIEMPTQILKDPYIKYGVNNS